MAQIVQFVHVAFEFPPGVLEENLVVLGHGHHKKHAIHVIEAMDPLFTFGFLAAHIKHVKYHLFVFKLNLKSRFENSIKNW